MDAGERDALHARLRTLERRQRAMMIGWALSAAVFIVLAGAVRQAGSQATTVRAREVVIVDDQGRKALSLGIDTKGLGGIWFYPNGANDWQAAVGFAGTTPSITMKNAGATVQLGFDTLNLPGLWYYDASDKKRLTLGFGGSDPGIWIYDASGNTTWHAP